MKRVGVLFWCLLWGGFFHGQSWAAQKKKPRAARGGAIAQLVGNWSGTSLCVNKEKFPACNDEQVIYHIALTPGKADTVTITADKIVSGKPETMGGNDYIYDPQKQTLTGAFQNARVHIIMELAVKGDTLEGTIATLPERVLVRQINLKKDKQMYGESNASTFVVNLLPYICDLTRLQAHDGKPAV